VEGESFASQSIPSWTQIIAWLREMETLRNDCGLALELPIYQPFGSKVPTFMEYKESPRNLKTQSDSIYGIIANVSARRLATDDKKFLWTSLSLAGVALIMAPCTERPVLKILPLFGFIQ